ncbi:MAG: hypothetical protein E6G97_25860 [Alphaproteobacteria bacterium]|nr:MAG: hypothetical protein E6G97_25860 [Alphaproteobacteria bacterium]
MAAATAQPINHIPTRRRALLRVAPEILAQRLGLEPGVQVLAATSEGGHGIIVLCLEGGTLPLNPPDALPEVKLQVHIEDKKGERTASACWSTDPDHRWPVVR